MESLKDKVVYQIYPKSFRDSDGDGCGDLRGIIEKLDYLKWLGVDYVWSTPFFLSPQRDNGYDIADYYQVDPAFGTMEDAEELIREAGKRGIGIMFDMVFNHTSTEHEWFKKALAGEGEYQDYYIFREGGPENPPTNWESKFGGSAWEYVPSLKKWYLHLFDRTQADLNWENPKVREELKNVIRFWKEKGVRGFRFDVVNLISKPEVFENDDRGDGRRFYTDGPHVHEYLKELVRDTEIGGMITVGEMSSTSIENCIRYTNPQEKELAMCFHFHHLKVDYKNGDKWEIQPADYRKLKELFVSWQEGMEKNGGWEAVFWCNHDQPRAVSRFGDDKKYWKESAKMLAGAIHMMRGTPYIFQGEELGMTNAGYTDISQYRDVESTNYYQIMLERGKTKEEALHILNERSRDNGRTPMQWNGRENAGFTSGRPWISLPDNYKTINVEAEMADEDSILYYYRRLIAIRKEEPAVAEGSIEFIETSDPQILAYRRILGEDEILAIHNFGSEEKDVPPACKEGAYSLLLGNYKSDAEGVPDKLKAYESVILKKKQD
ncbi:MAG TPA: alpha,alpha-phosphotrehalase [Candidatus Caccovicinus merdipullorum]|uniref:Alpha,alpha-phosphotrehalase n=1 Tax=Candidatus Caccovicinus merdipullorum TaxID=2840724 RepID=A0A9D1GJV7_9FIRM|nr:alpha,alpha-phosphotrehalase [Candidatus Caccovicinus merdipullorum]